MSECGPECSEAHTYEGGCALRVSYADPTNEEQELAELIAPVMGAWTLDSPFHDLAPREVARAILAAGYRSELPELVSGREAATILGITRQRVHQLATEHPLFPAPVAHLAAGKIWLRADIEEFARVWTRKPGRPVKVQ